MAHFNPAVRSERILSEEALEEFAYMPPKLSTQVISLACVEDIFDDMRDLLEFGWGKLQSKNVDHIDVQKTLEDLAHKTGVISVAALLLFAIRLQ